MDDKRPPTLPWTLTRATASRAAATEAPDEDPLPDLPRFGRYAVLGELGRGGMGVVHRVVDPELGRAVALKAMRPGRSAARFQREARILAALGHPAIVPVHEVGRLEDGRPYLTMREVDGRPLHALVQRLHEGEDGSEAAETLLFRLVDTLRQVAEAVAHAHERGVLHRDIKPDNILVGRRGVVSLVDWGLAWLVHDPDPEDDPRAGTPGFRAPELLEGTAPSAASDVYGLGATLAVILTGRPPTADGRLSIRGEVPPAEDLRQTCLRALASDPARRTPDADTFAQELQAWLDGTRERERARAELRSAERALAEADGLRAQAAELRLRTEEAQAGLTPADPPEAYHHVWALEDRLEAMETRIGSLEATIDARLAAALAHHDGLIEAHDLLADRIAARHRQAEGSDQRRLLGALEDALRRHDRRGRYAAYLEGSAGLTLVTDPPARAALFRWELRHRVLTPVFERDLGTAPIHRERIPHGSWLVKLEVDGLETCYPIHVGRDEHWDGVPPGASEPYPIPLPRPGDLPQGTRYVPATWARVGPWRDTARNLTHSHPRMRVWVDGIVIDRDPVTNRRYLAFLNDLVAKGHHDQAARWVPRERPGPGETIGAPCYARGPDGRYHLTTDADGHTWQPDWPVVLVNAVSAVAMARWRRTRDGHPWRLPGEAEYQLAAVGPDGRTFPWGETRSLAFVDAARAPNEPLPVPVDRVELDVGPYGVRGMATTVACWVHRDPTVPLPHGDGERALAPALEDFRPDGIYQTLGGTFISTPRIFRTERVKATGQSPLLGFRLCASVQGWR